MSLILAAGFLSIKCAVSFIRPMVLQVMAKSGKAQRLADYICLISASDTGNRSLTVTVSPSLV